MNKIHKKHLSFRVASPDDDFHYFVGYYNICPWSKDQSKIVAHRINFADRFPTGTEEISLGTIDIESSEFNCIARTKAWNFQQGAKLQWLTLSRQECLVHNDFEGGDACTMVRDTRGNVVRKIGLPFYSISPVGKYAVGINFQRINLCRPEYGYPVLGSEREQINDECDGLWLIDLETGENKVILTIDRLTKEYPALKRKENTLDYFIHAVFNPQGDRLLFLHRFLREDGITHTRLFTIGTNGGDLRLLMEGMVSHFDWLNNTTILAWAGTRSLLAQNEDASIFAKVKGAFLKSLKPIYYALGKPRFLMVRIVGDSYHFIDDSATPDIRPFRKGLFLTDGHCTFSNNAALGKWLLTDGYPDRSWKLPLYLYDMEKNFAYEIAKFPCPKEFDGDIRVDLHPRFNVDCNQVCFDFVNDSKRSIGIMDVFSVTKRSI